jgi:hypothetical protein
VALSATNVGGTGTATLTLTIASGAPLITSPLSVNIDAGRPFTYTITATGLQPITFSAANLPPGLTLSPSGSGVISGTPTTPGQYQVTLTATNIAGQDVETLVINVGTEPDDLDGDGFPNELEIALGTDPLNANSTPFGGKPANYLYPVQVINITALAVKLNFAVQGKDSITIQGKMPLLQALSANQQVTLVVGGMVSKFTLDAHGKGSGSVSDLTATASGTCAFALRAPKQPAPTQNSPLTASFTAKLAGDFAAALASRGLTDDNLSRPVSRAVRVFMLLDQTIVYDCNKLVSYTAKKGKTGTAKAVSTAF